MVATHSLIVVLALMRGFLLRFDFGFGFSFGFSLRFGFFLVLMVFILMFFGTSISSFVTVTVFTL